MAFLLRFGIPCLDRLLTGQTENTASSRRLPSGIRLGSTGSTSICIIGPEGTGKSVLGLHLASRYVTDCWQAAPRDDIPFVLYVSTDLNYDIALNRLWKAFRLNRPANRFIPFARDTAYRCEGNPSVTPLVKLQPIDTLDEMAKFLDSPRCRSRSNAVRLTVGFVDLARNTAGDDWGYVNRVLALLPNTPPGKPRHLIVIDAIEGFEALVGEKDAFGEPASRRARIAQIMRIAASDSGRCHVALIAEESRLNDRPPEVFIADFVIQLREVETNGYVRRTVQVHKARGYAHARGQHPFVIRSGNASTTGAQENFDDPFIGVLGRNQRSQAYFHIFRSLHYLSRTTMQKSPAERPSPPRDAFAGFGIHYLDDMLGGRGGQARIPGSRCDVRGLPACSVTALIGDSETQKTRLGVAFLSRCFASYPSTLVALIQELKAPSADKPGLRHILRWRKTALCLDFDEESETNRLCNAATAEERGHILQTMARGEIPHKDWMQPEQLADWLLTDAKCTNPEEGFAILLTTRDIDNRSLARDFTRLLPRRGPGAEQSEDPWVELARVAGMSSSELRKVAEDHFASRTICRRLEIHDLSSPILMHIVESAVQTAQDLQKGSKREGDTDQRFKDAVGIRLVIDDLSVLKETYPEIRNEPLFLPYLLFFLRREGITTLVINTHPQRAGNISDDRFEQEFRALVDNRIYTWHVPFFGEDRVAIAAIPPMTDAGVRELRPAVNDPVDLVVDPHFELYSGLEQGQPQLVPLEVRLFQETAAFEEYIKRENRLYDQLFSPAPGRTNVIQGQPADEYTVMRDFCSLDSSRHLNHTLLFQIDEFWALRKGALRPQNRYLDAVVIGQEGTAVPATDPFHLFQSTQSTQSLLRTRREAFRTRGYQLESNTNVELDRVPFTWDFGFLLCRERCWAEAEDKKLTFCGKPSAMVVAQVWNALKKVRGSQKGPRANDVLGAPLSTLGEPPEQVPAAKTWRAFLEACQIVARTRSSKSNASTPAFDFSLLAPESFSCLVLEMWASEILRRADVGDLKNELSSRTLGEPSKAGLISWLGRSAGPSHARTIKEQSESWLKDGTRDPGCWWIELYKIWLLLAEALNLPDFVDPGRSLQFKPHDPNPAAVAVRHWYKTAAAQSDSFDVTDPVRPCRLPGNFSVRGDWFLAVLSGSRSDRLADQALDLLSSRRANVTRLQRGLGLPTRQTVAETLNEYVRVKLFKCGVDGGRERVTYQDILHIGAARNEGFYWLWRSRLRDYDRHARVWQNWLGRTLLFWNRLRTEEGRNWISGFRIYDLIEQNRIAELNQLEIRSLRDFAARCDFLVAELRDATFQYP